ncbi:response regulator transcription factor [Candidatus Woesearchaeota archaeon]|nr:response regulator transcription factor [Candidatus Woesearchaeota archaeon]
MRYIMAAVHDIMFKARIQDTVREQGQAVTFTQHVEDVIVSKPDILIVDLNFADFQPIESIRKLRQVLPPTLKIVCFASHVDRDIQERAKHAGADVVMPRSRFVVQLPQFV